MAECLKETFCILWNGKGGGAGGGMGVRRGGGGGGGRRGCCLHKYFFPNSRLWSKYCIGITLCFVLP